MHFFKLVMQYKNKKFIYLVLLTAIPAVLFAKCFSVARIIGFFCNYGKMDLSAYSSVFLYLINYRGSLVWYLLGSIALCIAVISLLLGAVNRHMRVGDFTVSSRLYFRRLNVNLSATLMLTLASMLIIFTGATALAVFVYVFALTLSRGWAFVLSLLVFIIIWAVIILYFSLIILWAPTLIHTGLTAGRSLSLSVQKTSKYILQVAFSLTAASAPFLALMILNGLLNLKLGFFLDIVLYTVMIDFYVILMYSMFFEFEGIERADLKNISIWDKGYRS